MIGETLGHYRIVSQLGVGGMGAVYLAEDLKLERRVALKVLPPELAHNAERLARFRREARAVAALNHPHIVTLFAVEESDGRNFITMELVEGKPLNQGIPPAGLGLTEFFEYAIALADALAAAHEKGITHRDLKPANVMIDGSGRLKVIDFGLAKAGGAVSSPELSQLPTDQLTLEGRILGTPAYMAPEQVEGKSVDHRTDIFALGILFHEMLTGERPFKGDSNMSLMSAILKDQPDSISSLRPEIPLEISRIIKRCLHKQPGDRIQSALDLRNELKEIQAEFASGTLTSLQPSAGHRNEKGRIVNWTLGIVGVNLVLALVALFYWPAGETASDGGAGVNRALAPSGMPTITRLTTHDRIESMPIFSPDGRRLAFVVRVGAYKQIFIRDLESGTEEQVTEGDYDHIQPAWGPDTNTLHYARSIRKGSNIGLGDAKLGHYVTEEAMIRRRDLRTGDEVSLLEEAAYPTVAPGGTDLFFMRDGRIFRCDLNGKRVTQLTEDDSTWIHADPRVSADGSRVAFRRFILRERKHQLAVVTTNHVTTVVREAGSLFPTWHPSGAFIYFTTYRASGWNIWRLPVNADNTAAGEPEPVTVGAGDDLEAAFSPDGRRMVFSVSNVNADIYRLAVDPATGQTNGPPAEPLSFNSNREDSRASWAPSIEQPMLAFNSDRSGDMNLYLWREKDNSLTQVTTGGGGDYQATWSPDLQNLIFFSSRSGNAEIYRVSTNAHSEPVKLTDNPGLDYNPFYSPDGRHIVFASERNGSIDLHIMNADGSNPRKLVDGAGIAHYHTWWDADSVFNHVRIDGETIYARIFVADGRVEPVNTLRPVPAIGGHGSFSPDRQHYMDLDFEHSHIWALSLTSNNGGAIYTKPPNASSIDYPWWSPDGRWVTLDITESRSSELLMAEWPPLP